MQAVHYSLKNTFLVYWSGVYAGIITPGKLGEFIKVIYLKADKGISISKGFSSVLMDRLFDMYLLTVLAFIGIWNFCEVEKISNISLILSIVVILMPLLLLNSA